MSLLLQLMTGIGDVSRFTHREALTAFAGVDTGKNDCGQHVQKSVRAWKKSSPYLRKALFQIIDSLIKCSSATILFMPLWIKNGLRVNLITFT